MSLLPSIAIGADASTTDCKRLLDQVDSAARPGAAAKGGWKRLSKRGSGARVERIFQHGSGLCALVAQTPGELSVERLAEDIESLGAQAPKSATATEKSISGEARATPAAKAQLSRALGLSGQGSDEDEEMDDENSELYAAVIYKARSEPAGGPLRVALGNLFEFDLPSNDPDLENLFSIFGAAPGAPSPDAPHMLEELFGYDVIESPNESCDHWIHLPPAEAIALLLDNGFKPSSTALELTNPEHHPEYAAALRARVESAQLDAATPSARSSGPKPL